ncbi:MAG TPA: hypothetical protein VME22_31625 [Solirubrobacteraceae bacterium]|nr:hypothetical protein [Solirubrobacteraceae bacterium]
MIATGYRIGARRALAVSVSVLALVAVTGCGGSSKPSYCTNRANLESSVKGLTDLSASSGLSGLEAQLTKIQSDANALVSSAKSDFPNETSAIKSSVDTLTATVKGFSSSPSAADIAKLGTQAASAVTAVQNFYNSTSSKCS